MISKKMEKALNKQINAEFYSSYLYLAMAGYLETQNLPGFANWMYVQSQEEWEHGMKILNYINEQSGTVKLETIEAPEVSWKSPLDVFETAYAHEQLVTSKINDLVSLSNDEKDYATHIFLHWFVTEQVEEEASALAIVEKLKMIGDKVQGLFMLDRELAQRSAD
jgi:ferritin